MSLAMVHHYFGSKEGLYGACIDAMLAELSHLGGALKSELATVQGSPHALFERAVRVGFRFARDHRMAVRLLQRSIVDAGEVDAKIREANVLPFLAGVSEALGALLGRKPEALRLPIQSVVFLVVRYAISNDTELTLLAGDGKRDGQRGDEAVEDHLVDAAIRLLGIPAPN